MTSIAVLLSTYNGEDFLEPQLDSIINQTISNLKVYVRDDGSTDSTRKILKAYKKKYPNKFTIHYGENIGSSSSFFWLLQKVEADIYFFCDQDDIWLPNKIAIHNSSYEDSNKVQMTFSDMFILDGKEETFLGLQRIKASYLITKPTRMICQNCVAGCSMSINRKARDNIKKYGKIPDGLIHDHWFSVLTSLEGKVIFLPISLVKYRIHNKNQIGISIFNYSYLLNKFVQIKKTLRHDFMLINSLPISKRPNLIKYIITKVSVNISRLSVDFLKFK
tara:strand:+ start:28876 stop:29703 length:828 start_codon:yes stop_codon:yes gene_type:complete